MLGGHVWPTHHAAQQPYQLSIMSDFQKFPVGWDAHMSYRCTRLASHSCIECASHLTVKHSMLDGHVWAYPSCGAVRIMSDFEAFHVRYPYVLYAYNVLRRTHVECANHLTMREGNGHVWPTPSCGAAISIVYHVWLLKHSHVRCSHICIIGLHVIFTSRSM